MKSELAYTYNPLKDYGTSHWWASPKYDGVRGIYDPNTDEIYTRQNNIVAGLEKLAVSCDNYVKYMASLGIEITSVEGELWIPGKLFPEISGIVRDKKNYDQFLKDQIVFRVFATRSLVWRNTEEMINYLPEKDQYPGLVSVEYQLIENNPKSVEEFLRNSFNLAPEGIMLRSLNLTYVEGRSHSLLKVKKMEKGTFQITSINKGKGKNSNTMGYLQVQGIINGVSIKSRVGTGFTDAERNEIWANQTQFIGREVELVYMGITNGVNTSLRQPVFVKVV